MTKEEYSNALKVASQMYEEAKRRIIKEYAYSNNTVKAGDIVTDHIGSIRVEKVNVYLSIGEPMCVYSGIELLKSGKENARKSRRNVYQSNILNP